MNKISAVVLLFVAGSCLAQDLAWKPAELLATPAGSIAFNRGGTILLMDVATGVEKVLVKDNTHDRPLAWLPVGNRLLYWNHDGGAWDIWSIDPVSLQAANLTGTASDSRSAVGSPDGSTIAFQRGGDGVWLMAADGKNQRRIDARGHRDAPPAWSPSGKQLAFTDLESLGENRIALVTYVIALTDGKAGEARSLGRGEAAFFLDEGRLVITGRHDGAPEVIVVDVASGESKSLTKSAAYDSSPVLSPDGKLIAWFEDGAATEDPSRLKVMNTDGTGVHDLAAVQHQYAPPTWSPDGRFLAFESGPGRRELQVHLVSKDGGAVRALTSTGGTFPVWVRSQDR